MGVYPIGFRDADFPHVFMWAISSLEGTSLRWLPYGMPRLSPRLATTVFFLFGTNPMTGERIGPIGSGVLIGLTGTWGPMVIKHVYAVTAHHVLLKGGSIIRINTKDGGSRDIETEPAEWEFDEKGSDVAAFDITSRLARDGDDVWVIYAGDSVHKKFIDETGFGIGEDGFMLGLFADLPGRSHNMVAARFGNVSLMAHDDEPVPQPNGNDRPAHLFDMHSRPGSSGSPVFAYRTPSRDLRGAMYRGLDKRWKAAQRRTSPISASDAAAEVREIEQNTFLVLLGIHVAQYHDVAAAKKARPPLPQSISPAIREGDELELPNSMAVIVPAWDVLALLDRPKLFEQRKARDDRHVIEAQKGKTPKAEPAD